MYPAGMDVSVGLETYTRSASNLGSRQNIGKNGEYPIQDCILVL